MSQVAIRSIITTALATWAASKNIPIAREGQAFSKPDGTFLQLTIIPSPTIVATLDGERRRYMGDVMVNIWVRDGDGAGEGESLADEIATLFPVVPKNYLPVSVETVPSAKRNILDESGYIITPVTFSYRAEY